MLHRLSLLLTALGLVLLTAAGILAALNRAEDDRAGTASARLLASLTETSPGTAPTESAAAEPECLGRLRIPRLELELPVLARWSYEDLKTAPCRYSGTAAGADLVLLAHNYKKHFGPIRRLKPGDLVIFEDAGGTVYEYQVTESAVVEPTALEEVTAGRHALTLITCTYGGNTRLAVFCD